MVVSFKIRGLIANYIIFGGMVQVRLYDDRSAPKLNMFKFLWEFLQSGKQNNEGKKTVDAELKANLEHLQSVNRKIDAYRDRSLKVDPMALRC